MSPSTRPRIRAWSARPREVTLGGMQAIAGSVLALVLLLSTAQQLNGEQMTKALSDVVNSQQAATVGLTVETARELLRYAIMVLSVLSVASLVLGIYVLRRHRTSRVALTIIGTLVAAASLVGGPVGWLVTLYIGVSMFLIWSRPARAWFAGGDAGGRGDRGRSGGREVPVDATSEPPFGPPRGPRRDVGDGPPPSVGGSPGEAAPPAGTAGGPPGPSSPSA